MSAAGVRVRRWRRVAVPLAVLAVVAAVAAAARARRRAAPAAATSPSKRTSRPLGGRDVHLGEAGPKTADARGFAPFPAFAPFAPLPDFRPVQAPDDRDTRGEGLPIAPEQAALELREEHRFETAVFVRSILILVGIALLLTARTIWV